MFDSFQPNFEESEFALGVMDWKDFFGDIREDIPLGVPVPLRKSAHKTCFVYTDHSGKCCYSDFSHRCIDLCDECANYLVLKEVEYC